MLAPNEETGVVASITPAISALIASRARCWTRSWTQYAAHAAWLVSKDRDNRGTGAISNGSILAVTSHVDAVARSRSILSRRRRDAVLVLFEFPGQAEKTSYQIFVLSLQLGIVNLFCFLVKHLSQPFTIRAWVHDLRPTREPIEAFPLTAQI